MNYVMDKASSVQIDWLRRVIFSNPEKRVFLDTGEQLLSPNEANNRLFFVLKGALVGFIIDHSGNRFEVFKSTTSQIVGAYSFFSKKHRGYATVVAQEPSIVAFVDAEDFERGIFDYEEFAQKILPIIVEEIHSRQMLAHQMSMERQKAIDRLHEVEKSAALGQMAAGLAHELNNAIGVIRNKSLWLVERISEYIQDKDQQGFFNFFQKGLQSGQELSSVEMRKKRKSLEATLGLSPNEAKAIARMNLSNKELKTHERDLLKHTNRIQYYYETGLAIHDMLVASEHASEVVKSVQNLGASIREELVDTDINACIQKSIT
ncbi:MAG: cyclic nucleotide-binding domain-containing protein, partial [Bacteroidota bacterium]